MLGQCLPVGLLNNLHGTCRLHILHTHSNITNTSVFSDVTTPYHIDHMFPRWHGKNPYHLTKLREHGSHIIQGVVVGNILHKQLEQAQNNAVQYIY